MRGLDGYVTGLCISHSMPLSLAQALPYSDLHFYPRGRRVRWLCRLVLLSRAADDRVFPLISFTVLDDTDIRVL